MTPLRPCRRARSAFSYVELCLAIAILAMCIVPATQALPGLLAGQRALEARYQLSLIAQEKLDSATLDLENSFAERDGSGDLADRGYPDWRYHLVVTIPVEGGGRYAVLRSEAWVDEDGDATMDADEPQVRFDTIHSNRKWSP